MGAKRQLVTLWGPMGAAELHWRSSGRWGSTQIWTHDPSGWGLLTPGQSSQQHSALFPLHFLPSSQPLPIASIEGPETPCVPHGWGGGRRGLVALEQEDGTHST